MAIATRRQFIKRCEELGVKYSINDEDVVMDAPLGFHFGVGNHHYIAKNMRFDHMSKAEVYEFMLEDMSMGVEKCDSDCEYCQDNRKEI